MRTPLAVRLVAVAAALALPACSPVTESAMPGGEQGQGEAVTPAPPPELPGGGRTLFPDRRMIAYYGNGESEALGILGETSPEQAAQALVEAAAPFATPERPVLPTFELITTTVQDSPGSDGDYSGTTDPEIVQTYLDAVREVGGYLVLDFQPGRGEFLPQVQMYEQFLRQPDVGIALDSEWRMGPDEVPGEVIGSMTGAEVNEVSAYLDQITAEENLPEKLLLLHHFRLSMITDRESIVDRDNLAIVWHADGFGPRQVKLEAFEVIKPPPGFPIGFKLFYDEDDNLYSPQETITTYDPDFVSYQ